MTSGCAAAADRASSGAPAHHRPAAAGHCRVLRLCRHPPFLQGIQAHHAAAPRRLPDGLQRRAATMASRGSRELVAPACRSASRGREPPVRSRRTPGLGELPAVSDTREVREVREVRCDVPWPGRPQVSMSAHLLGMTPGTPRFGLTHAGQSFLTNQWCVLPMPRAPLMDRLHRMRTAAVRPRTRCVGANQIRSSQNQRRIRCCIHG